MSHALFVFVDFAVTATGVDSPKRECGLRVRCHGQRYCVLLGCLRRVVESEVVRRSRVSMSTVVTIEVVERGQADRDEIDQAMEAAFRWFDVVEDTCSRFLEQSEVRRLSTGVGRPTPVSPLLFEVLAFALATAEASGGAFDPTMGAELAERGFDREHRSGVARGPASPHQLGATYRDVRLDPATQTVTLERPLVIDLGGVAKGLAIDLAAAALAPFRHFAIDAGGDVFASGRNVDDALWTIGIRHPREAGAIVETVHVTDQAVCTSGDYERTTGSDGEHHLLDPRTRTTSVSVASATVRSSRAIVADALATAAFVMGPVDGATWLERQGVAGLLFTPALTRVATEAW